MFSKIFAIFALIAVAFAAPNPKPAPVPAPAPAPAPQYLTYSAGLNYPYASAAYVPSVVSPYSAPAAYAYSGYPAINNLYY